MFRLDPFVQFVKISKFCKMTNNKYNVIWLNKDCGGREDQGASRTLLTPEIGLMLGSATAR